LSSDQVTEPLTIETLRHLRVKLRRERERERRERERERTSTGERTGELDGCDLRRRLKRARVPYENCAREASGTQSRRQEKRGGGGRGRKRVEARERWSAPTSSEPI
jgi:hypothetical protein